VTTDIGEYIVGAYLKLVERCDVIDYNVRPPGGGVAGLSELDVIGLDFNTDTAYLCEATTHIRGVLYKNNQETVRRIEKKYSRQQDYAMQYLKNFKNHRFMFWSPVVPRGYITEHITNFNGLELIINGEYKERINELMQLAKTTTHDSGNPFFRMLQIMGHMRD